MIKQVSHGVLQDFTCGQSGPVPRTHARYRQPRDDLDRPSQARESPAVPVVVLVEQHDDVFDRLTECFTAVGFRVARAKTSAGAVKSYVSAPAELLVVNADQPAETAWLLAAKLHLTHPAARIWVYVFQPSTFDVAAANLLAIEELIEYDGEVAELESQLLDRLGVPANRPAPCSSSSARSDPAISAADACGRLVGS